MALSQINMGLIQMRCLDDPAKNLDTALKKISEARKKGGHVVCLSELFCSPYFCQKNNDHFFKLAEVVPGPTTKALSESAKKEGVVVIGSIYERDGRHLYNTAVVLDADGRYLGKYRKLHIPDDPEHYYSESYYFKPGNLGVPVFQTQFGKISVLVCWDQWFPETARLAAEKGAQILFYPTAIGWQLSEKGNEVGQTEFDAWVTIQRSHAIANGIFVASANRVGLEQNIDFWGGSFVCNPFGQVLRKAPHDKEELLVVPCDLSQIEETRRSWPFLQCRRLNIVERE